MTAAERGLCCDPYVGVSPEQVLTGLPGCMGVRCCSAASRRSRTCWREASTTRVSEQQAAGPPTRLSRATRPCSWLPFVGFPGRSLADSAGNQGNLNSGWCQWMTAGRGVVHSEMPTGGWVGEAQAQSVGCSLLDARLGGCGAGRGAAEAGRADGGLPAVGEPPRRTQDGPAQVGTWVGTGAHCDETETRTPAACETCRRTQTAPPTGRPPSPALCQGAAGPSCMRA